MTRRPRRSYVHKAGIVCLELPGGGLRSMTPHECQVQLAQHLAGAQQRDGSHGANVAADISQLLADQL